MVTFAWASTLKTTSNCVTLLCANLKQLSEVTLMHLSDSKYEIMANLFCFFPWDLTFWKWLTFQIPVVTMQLNCSRNKILWRITWVNWWQKKFINYLRLRMFWFVHLYKTFHRSIKESSLAPSLTLSHFWRNTVLGNSIKENPLVLDITNFLKTHNSLVF